LGANPVNGLFVMFSLRVSSEYFGPLGAPIATALVEGIQNGVLTYKLRRIVLCERGVRFDGNTALGPYGGHISTPRMMPDYERYSADSETIEIPWDEVDDIQVFETGNAWSKAWRLLARQRTLDFKTAFIAPKGGAAGVAGLLRLRSACLGADVISPPSFGSIIKSKSVYDFFRFCGGIWYANRKPGMDKAAEKLKARFPECGEVFAVYDRALWGFDGFGLTDTGVVVDSDQSPSKPSFLPWGTIEAVSSTLDGDKRGEVVTIRAVGGEHRVRIVRSADDEHPLFGDALSHFLTMYRVMSA